MTNLDMPFKDEAAVLVVDDEPDILWAIRDCLVSMNITCYCAGDAMSALQMMAGHPDIRILLSDVRMPDRDGPWLISKIGGMLRGSSKPVAFVLMSDAPFPPYESLSDGVRNAGLLPKPFSSKELKDALLIAWETLQDGNGRGI